MRPLDVVLAHLYRRGQLDVAQVALARTAEDPHATIALGFLLSAPFIPHNVWMFDPPRFTLN